MGRPSANEYKTNHRSYFARENEAFLWATFLFAKKKGGKVSYDTFFRIDKRK
ncbi:MAG: SH3 domain-containing protein [Brevinematia bacterium]